jgi:hypothetical protein
MSKATADHFSPFFSTAFRNASSSLGPQNEWGRRAFLVGGSSFLIEGGKDAVVDEEDIDDSVVLRSSDIDRFVETGGFVRSIVVVVLSKILVFSGIGKLSVEMRRE